MDRVVDEVPQKPPEHRPLDVGRLRADEVQVPAKRILLQSPRARKGDGRLLLQPPLDGDDDGVDGLPPCGTDVTVPAEGPGDAALDHPQQAVQVLGEIVVVRAHAHRDRHQSPGVFGQRLAARLHLLAQFLPGSERVEEPEDRVPRQACALDVLAVRQFGSSWRDAHRTCPAAPIPARVLRKSGTCHSEASRFIGTPKNLAPAETKVAIFSESAGLVSARQPDPSPDKSGSG